MRPTSLLMRTVALGIVCCSLTGCVTGSTMLPEKGFTGLSEVFPEKEALKGPPVNAPQEGVKRVSFEAPFEDVWRAVTVGVTQAQLNIESSQKGKGLILGTSMGNDRIRGAKNPGGYSLSVAILIKEKGPKSSELILFSKVQVECPSGTRYSTGRTCEELSTPHWASDNERFAIVILNNVIVLTRNNLFAAGAL